MTKFCHCGLKLIHCPSCEGTGLIEAEGAELISCDQCLEDGWICDGCDKAQEHCDCHAE